jgi:hypothetical protein
MIACVRPSDADWQNAGPDSQKPNRFDEMKDRTTQLGVWALHTLALFALAIAQPVFSTIGEAPEFLVAHNATPLVIVAFAVGLALIAPLAIIAVEWLVSRIYRPAGKVLHGLVVLVLLGIIAQQVLDRFLDLDVKLLLGLSLLLAVLASFLYWRSATVSRMVSIAAIGALLLPLNFLFVSPASKLVVQLAGATDTAPAPRKRTPIVMLILDEFNITPLFDENGDLDSVRYPGFGELAENSWWFRKAISPHHQTQFAVPALLTGKLPDPAKDVPSHSDHPRNLFTMLGEHYEFNVRESLTSLCPIAFCPSSERGLDLGEFTSDLAVVVGHALTPRSLADAVLPPLGNGWRGFGKSRADVQNRNAVGRALVQRFNEEVAASRATVIDRFITSSGAQEGRLDLLHVLLPHAPYEFLPSGRSYYRLMSQEGLKDGRWTDQLLIDHTYLRYMMQVGMVDRKISELIGSLKQKGVYDESLVIVTADHGRGFRSGVLTRALEQDNGDMLHVPLFIKLPRQPKGMISDAFVSTMDILPTIADVLGIETGWDFDGRSLFDEKREYISRIQVKVKNETYSFDSKDVTSLPLLNWQVATFGSRRPLSETSIIRPYSELIGRDLDSLQVDTPDQAPDIQLRRSLSSYSVVELESGIVPSLLQTEVAGKIANDDRSIAIAVNGMIADVAPIYRNEAGSLQLTAFLPEKYFRDGTNEVAAFLVESRTDGRPVLTSLSSSEERYTISSDRRSLTSSSGNQVAIAGKGHGNVDALEVRGSVIFMRGWSFERTTFQPAKSVVLFRGDEFICSTPVTLERQDLVARFKAESTRYSGFSVHCPLPDTATAGEAFHVYAIDGEGKAVALRVPPVGT